MNGRLENDARIERKITNVILVGTPGYLTEWYTLLRASGTTMSSCESYLNIVKNFIRFCGDDGINQITTNKYFISIQTKEKNGTSVRTSDSYQQLVWCCLNNFMEFMVSMQYLKTNHVKLIKKSKNTDLDRINKNRVLLTQEDFANILAAVDRGAGSHRAKARQQKFKNRDKIILLLFMTTGMRKTALEEINIEDIDFNRKTLTVIDKGEKTHVYVLTDQVMRYLNVWKVERLYIAEPTESALFVSANGTRMSQCAIADIVKKYCKEGIGRAVSPHKLRAGFCSILYEQTGDIEFVRRAVGHSRVDTTQRYIVTDGKERETSANIMSGLLDKTQ